MTDNTGHQKGYNHKYHNSFLAKVERNQTHITRTLLVALHCLHFIYPYGVTSKFIRLQYKIGNTSHNELVYDIGIEDTYYAIRWVILLTFLRSFLMQWCFKPFATHVCNIHSKKALVRFSEQSWLFVYYTCSFIVGFYLYYNSSYWLDIDNIYLGWPHYQLSPLFKKYYLISTAFWIHQLFVLQIEERRKDHWEMFSHHIITCLLVVGSYYYYYNRIGHLILMIMDSVDIIFAAAKLLKYSKMNTACDAMFFLFLVSWVILRHGLYNYLFYHTWSKASVLMKNAECVAGVAQKRCWNRSIVNTFLGLLGGLQVITLIWMYLIIKVAYKVIIGAGAEDIRSDQDNSDSETEECSVAESKADPINTDTSQ